MAFIVRNTFVRSSTSVEFFPDDMRTSEYNSTAASAQSTHTVTRTRNERSGDDLTLTLEFTASSEDDWEDYQTEMSMSWTNAGFLDWLINNSVTMESEIIENT